MVESYLGAADYDHLLTDDVAEATAAKAKRSAKPAPKRPRRSPRVSGL